MGKLSDFLFGSGPLKKAAGDAAPPAVPSVNAPTIDIAGMAEKQAAAARAKGNDAGMGSRGSAGAMHPNDAGIKARAKSLPAQPTQPNDAGMRGRGGDDE